LELTVEAGVEAEGKAEVGGPALTKSRDPHLAGCRMLQVGKKLFHPRGKKKHDTAFCAGILCSFLDIWKCILHFFMHLKCIFRWGISHCV